MLWKVIWYSYEIIPLKSGYLYARVPCRMWIWRLISDWNKTKKLLVLAAGITIFITSIAIVKSGTEKSLHGAFSNLYNLLENCRTFNPVWRTPEGQSQDYVCMTSSNSCTGMAKNSKSLLIFSKTCQAFENNFFDITKWNEGIRNVCRDDFR